VELCPGLVEFACEGEVVVALFHQFDALLLVVQFEAFEDGRFLLLSEGVGGGVEQVEHGVGFV
jgi:hypothetical protein